MTNINIDSTYGVVIIQDLDVVYADENYAKLYGYENTEQLLTHIDSFLELIPEEFHEKAKRNYTETIAGRMTPRGKTFTNVDRYGKDFTVFSVDHVIEWRGRKALQVTIIDLSMMIEANDKIREKDLMFKRLIMNSGQGILIHRNFKPLMVNQAWVDAMQADSIEDAMAVDSILQFIPSALHNEAKAHYQDLMDGTSDSKSSIVENICFDGQKRFFNIYDSPIEWDGERAMQVVLEDFTDKVALENAIAYKASHDQLTDLFNRSSVYEWLDEHIKPQDDIVCLLMDIDDFKKVNDTYGHQIGDKVIQSLSHVIKKTTQAFSGVAGRWGGEEFIVFLKNTSLEEAQVLAENMRVQFNQVQHEKLSTGVLNASVSIGISPHYRQNNISNIDELIKLADKHLYFAKAKGKNCVVNIADKLA